MKIILHLLIAFTFVCSIYGQEKKVSNSIIYFEGFGGFSLISDAGFGGGFELNYQKKKDLFSFRVIKVAGYVRDYSKYNLVISQYSRTKHDNEYALLYGKRWLEHNCSYSISGGLSYNHFISDKIIYNKNYIGIPFESNVIWYSSKKKNNLGNVITPKFGFKLFGNISNNSFIGLGISLGIGYHK
jgi:hypothetical protein